MARKWKKKYKALQQEKTVIQIRKYAPFELPQIALEEGTVPSPYPYGSLTPEEVLYKGHLYRLVPQEK
jgi:hypothetical protein